MSWVPAEQVLATVAAQRQVLAEQDARMASVREFHQTERKKAEASGIQAAGDLAQALLPSLDAASIARAAQAVGLPGLAAEDIPHKLEARRAWLASRLRAILSDPRYANAELLRHPRTGTLVTALAEAQEMRGPSAQIIAACVEHPRWARLVEVRYGTPEHTGSWWRYSHWLDRSAAEEIRARFPGKETFADVLEELQRAQQTVATYDAEISHLRAEIAAGEALAAEYAQLYDEHLHLDARGLEHTRARLVQHLLTADASMMSQRLATWPDVRMLFLRTSGLAAKVAYLDGIQRAQLAEIEKDVAGQRQKLATVEQRTRRRWAPMPVESYQKLAEDRRPRYEKRWQRFGKVYTQVNAYDRWDRGRRFEQLLWWDVMTRGRYDGSYLVEVQTFHQHHPSYVFDPELLRGRGTAIAGSDGPADEPADLGTIDVDDEAQAAALAADDDLDPGGGAGLAATDAS